MVTFLSNHWHQIVDVITVVGLVLAVVALVLAWKQLRDLQRVQNSLSTRYIGQFPEHMDEVVKLVKSAKRNLTIVCDVPAYCSFTRPELGLAYKQALEGKKYQAGFKTLRFICLSDREIDAFHHEQLDPDTTDDKWPEFKKHFDTQLNFLIRDYGSAETFESLTREQFFNLVMTAHKSMMAGVLQRWHPGRFDTTMPIYFWIADDFRGVLAIPVLADGVTEICFATNDQQILKALMGLYSRLNRKAAIAGNPSASPTPAASSSSTPSAGGASAVQLSKPPPPPLGGAPAPKSTEAPR
ncbi:MAG: hypothetical protein ABR964_15160 [Tepidisphaeraceae bacterium]|jgi:hypothetical protein